MTTRYQLSCSTRFYASPDQVWALKTDLERIGEEMSPLLRFSLDEAAARAALRGEGVPRTVDGKIWGLVSWPFEFVSYAPGQRFVDRSSNALFSAWEHEHIVEQASDAVRYVDIVRFTPAVGPAKLVAIAVQRFFQRRHRRAARHLPTDGRATAVALLREDREIEKEANRGFM